MSSRTIRFIIILATLAIIGVTVTQVYWVRQAINLEKREFQRNVNLALREVAEDFFEITNKEPPTLNPIIRISENSYVVMVNSHIDANLLEILLKRSFPSYNLYTDFQYSIYESGSSDLVFRNDVQAVATELLEPETNLPVFDKGQYYFGVIFPSRTSLLFDRMQVWVFSTAILLVVIIFFAYALFVILKQKRLSEIQKDFINNMTHEFKTPISTIEIATEVLKDPDIKERPERLIKYATIIENENQRLKHQVDRVLQVASLTRDKIQLKKESLDMHEILLRAIDQITSSKPSTKITTKLHAANQIIRGDQVHLTNVIYNLLENAIKYSVRDPEILIRTYNTGKYFTMSFKDNGIGISAEHQKNIFGKFYRVPTGDLHDSKGFGIGLHYVRLIVEAHGGSVSLESEKEKGSTFEVKLPI